MPFCTNCGQEVSEEAKFCRNCGAPTGVGSPTYQEKRRTVFAGEVRKCPSCGAELPSMVAVCPSCGYEINSQSVHPTVVKLSNELSKCDQEIAHEEQSGIGESGWATWGIWGKLVIVIVNFSTMCIPFLLYRLHQISHNRPRTPATVKKATLIENIQVPNEKEAIVEMLYFIETKIDGLSVQGKKEINLYWANLWKLKADFLRDKANLLIPGDSVVTDIYESITAKVEKLKSAVFFKKAQIIVMIIGIILLGLIFVSSSTAYTPKYDTYNTKSIDEATIKALIPGKKERDGFDEGTNRRYTIGNIELLIPSYYDREKTDDTITYLYADSEETTVMLMLDDSDTETDIESVSIRAIWEPLIDGYLNNFENVELLATKDIQEIGLEGKTILFVSDIASTKDVYQMATFILDGNTSHISVISLAQTSVANYNYFMDYEKIISSAALIK